MFMCYKVLFFNIGYWIYNIQYTEYHGNTKSFYDTHMDSYLGSGELSDRKLSMTIQLSDSEEYEGGEFQLINTSMAPHEEYDKRVLTISELKQKGSVLMFPSYLYHQVTKVTKVICDIVMTKHAR